MKLVIKDKYNITINDYARKIVVSKNVCFGGGLESSYPTATTPLADTDKVIIRQGTEWREADKSEFGGQTTEYIYVNWSANISVSDDKYSFLQRDNGTFGTSVDKLNFDDNNDCYGYWYVPARHIQSGYALVGIRFRNRYSSANADYPITIYFARRNQPEGNHGTASYQDVEELGNITINQGYSNVINKAITSSVITKVDDAIVWCAKFGKSVTGDKVLTGADMQLIFKKI